MPVVVRVIDDPDPDVPEEEGHDLGAAPPVWPSDDELAVAARRDPDRFGELYERYRDSVYRYCWARSRSVDDAADLTQQTFALAYRGLDKYRRGPGGFAAWLFRIARNAANDAQRRRRTLVPLDSVPEPMSTGAAGEPADQLIAGEEIARVRAALARLKSDEQDLIALHFAAGLTVKEAGAAVGKSESTARMRLWRAVRKLRKDLEK